MATSLRDQGSHLGILSRAAARMVAAEDGVSLCVGPQPRADFTHSGSTPHADPDADAWCAWCAWKEARGIPETRQRSVGCDYEDFKAWRRFHVTHNQAHGVAYTAPVLRGAPVDEQVEGVPLVRSPSKCARAPVLELEPTDVEDNEERPLPDDEVIREALTTWKRDPSLGTLGQVAHTLARQHDEDRDLPFEVAALPVGDRARHMAQSLQETKVAKDVARVEVALREDEDAWNGRRSALVTFPGDAWHRDVFNQRAVLQALELQGTYGQWSQARSGSYVLEVTRADPDRHWQSTLVRDRDAIVDALVRQALREVRRSEFGYTIVATVDEAFVQKQCRKRVVRALQAEQVAAKFYRDKDSSEMILEVESMAMRRRRERAKHRVQREREGRQHRARWEEGVHGGPDADWADSDSSDVCGSDPGAGHGNRRRPLLGAMAHSVALTAGRRGDAVDSGDDGDSSVATEHDGDVAPEPWATQAQGLAHDIGVVKVSETWRIVREGIRAATRRGLQAIQFDQFDGDWYRDPFNQASVAHFLRQRGLTATWHMDKRANHQILHTKWSGRE